MQQHLSHFLSVLPGLMSSSVEALVSTEKLTNPSKIQPEPHLSSDAVLGQLVAVRIGLENGLVLLLSSQPYQGQALLAHGWFLEPTSSAP